MTVNTIPKHLSYVHILYFYKNAITEYLILYNLLLSKICDFLAIIIYLEYFQWLYSLSL